jgi:hypothetical protein
MSETNSIQRIVELIREHGSKYDNSTPPCCLELSGQDAARLIDWLDTAVEQITDMVAQNCTHGDKLDSSALTTHAEAMWFLADMGRLEITAEAGRRVIGKWPEPAKLNQSDSGA